MNERLTPEQEREIRERLHQNGRAHDLLVDATSDIRALLAEIDALRRERDDLEAGVLVGSLALHDFEERLDRITAVAEETAERARDIMAAAHANYESADSWRHRCQGVEEDLKMSQSNYKTLLDNEVRLRRRIKDMQADTARAVELLEPLTRMRDVPPGTLRVQIEHALRYLRPLEDESKTSS